jgi:hypothetical protein
VTAITFVTSWRVDFFRERALAGVCDPLESQTRASEEKQKGIQMKINANRTDRRPPEHRDASRPLSDGAQLLHAADPILRTQYHIARGLGYRHEELVGVVVNWPPAFDVMTVQLMPLEDAMANLRELPGVPGGGFERLFAVLASEMGTVGIIPVVVIMRHSFHVWNFRLEPGAAANAS